MTRCCMEVEGTRMNIVLPRKGGLKEKDGNQGSSWRKIKMCWNSGKIVKMGVDGLEAQNSTGAR